MRRRDFISLIGGAAAWPFAARALQPAMPVIGYLNSTTPEGFSGYLRALRKGLNESGYVGARISRSNIAGPRTDPSGWQTWPPTSFADGST